MVFDTDVDRSAVIDAAGLEINRNKLIAVLAAIVLREHPGTTIVTDSVTSDGLAAYIQNKGGKHLRYMRGYKNVIDKVRPCAFPKSGGTLFYLSAGDCLSIHRDIPVPEGTITSDCLSIHRDIQD